MAKIAEKSFPSRVGPRIVGDRPSHEQIALRAYQIFLERGGAPGRELDDWLRAERELVTEVEKTGPIARARAS